MHRKMQPRQSGRRGRPTIERYCSGYQSVPGKLPSRQGEWKGKVTGKRPSMFFAPLDATRPEIADLPPPCSRRARRLANDRGRKQRRLLAGSGSSVHALIATAILPIATAREWAARVIGRPFKCSELEPLPRSVSCTCLSSALFTNSTESIAAPKLGAKLLDRFLVPAFTR